MNSRGPNRSASAPKRRARRKMHDRRSAAVTGLRRAAVSADLLEEDDQEERGDAQRAVEREGREVADAEIARAEDRRTAASAPRIGAPRSTNSDQQHAAGDQREQIRADRSSRRSAVRSVRRSGRPRPQCAQSSPPTQSTVARSVGGRAGICRSSHSVTSTSGTLTMNTQRHEPIWTSRPPSSGPATVAIPVQAVQVPIAAAR